MKSLHSHEEMRKTSMIYTRKQNKCTGLMLTKSCSEEFIDYFKKDRVNVEEKWFLLMKLSWNLQ